jgi:hypothetical protein
MCDSSCASVPSTPAQLISESHYVRVTRQRVLLRGAAGRSAGRAEHAAGLPLWPLRRAAERNGVHCAAQVSVRDPCTSDMRAVACFGEERADIKNIDGCRWAGSACAAWAVRARAWAWLHRRRVCTFMDCAPRRPFQERICTMLRPLCLHG